MEGGFRVDEVLKQDPFGAIERGVLNREGTDREGVRRNVARAPWFARPVARWLAAREARALERIMKMEVRFDDGGLANRLVPRVLARSRTGLVRSWIEGRPMHLAEPRDPLFYVRARRLLRDLRRCGVLHGDTAKEPNWLVTPSGEPALVDFQLAVVFRVREGRVRGMRGRVARAVAREDLRHLLKHKRTYCPGALTDRERRILSRPGRVSRFWRATFRRVYNVVTRRIFDWSDREGVGRKRPS